MFIGANVEEVDQLAVRLQGHGGALIDVSHAVGRLVESLGEIWVGPDAERFRADWVSSVRPSLLGAADSIDRATATLARNAAAQRATSEGYGAGASIFPGTGGGAGSRYDDLGGRPMTTLPIGEDGSFIKEGDSGGTLSSERRADIYAESSREAAIEALRRMDGNAGQIANDEFQLITLEDGTHMLVLPGVTDLTETGVQFLKTVMATDPDLKLQESREFFELLGIDPHNQTPRDTFDIAFKSLRSGANLDQNAYGVLVERFVAGEIAAGRLDPDADVMIVGHSFGADTALDLVADERFNGDLVNVTHVVAAGYHNEPQLSHIQNGTKVAVIQNIYDIPVIAEGAIMGDVRPGIDAVRGHVGSHIERSVNPAIDGVNIVAEGGAEVVEAVGERSINAVPNLVNTIIPGRDPIPTVDFELDAPDIPPVDLTHDRIREVSPGVYVVEFHGGMIAGAGHSIPNYTDYLDGRGSHHLADFFRDADGVGYSGNGRSEAIDISIPEDLR